MTDEPPASNVVWEDGAPRSLQHGDVYFSRDGGLSESRAVFLAGCGLPERWAGRRRFVVAELGFGTGLNIAALLDLWARTRDPGARLHVFTIENDPLDALDAARALAAFPELAPITALMTARWPGRARGFHRMDLPELGAVVDVATEEAMVALEDWNGAADAWFLDGFAPALNPDIWRPEVIDRIALRSAPGAWAATYTVAGQVRRNLAAAGFAVERRRGHGRKRERLEARLPGVVVEPPAPRVTIIGGGIAGASLAQAFRDLGAPARVIDPRPPGSGASGAPAGLAAARLDAGLGPAAALFAQAARRAAQLYDVLDGAVVARGALQLASGPKDPGRFAAIESSDLFESGQMRRVAGEAATATAGAPLGEGLLMDGARVIRPSAILAAWLGETETAEVATIAPGASGWRLVATTGAELGDADVVCVAAAMVTATLAPGLELMPVRGQITFTTSATWKLATLFGGYVIPSVGGLVFGATHDRNDTAPEARPADRARNLAGLASALPNLAAALQSLPLEDWTAVRATTRDYLPLAGETGDPVTGRLVLTGLGSRGFCLAPLLAEHLAAIALQAPSPLPRSLAALVDPGRFAARASRKGRPRA